MNRTAVSRLLALAVFALPVTVLAAPPQEEPTPIRRNCSTAEPTAAIDVAARAALGRFRAQPQGGARGGTVQVAVHVIHSGTAGNVSDEQIGAQIRELNRGYAGSGFRFELESVDRTDNVSWFKMKPGTGSETHAKRALAIDPAHTLNLYTCSPGQNLLGWATFPFSLPEDSFLHGVVVHYGSLPGGIFTAYSLGRTATHEVGHYLGLFHTFQGGCVAPGDGVDDTPFEAGPAFGCPEGRDTCEQPGVDPIENYMDYSDDACMTEFSAGQVERMQAAVESGRPNLFLRGASPRAGEVAAEAAAATPLLQFRGAFPNPAPGETVLRFSLTEPADVSLAIFDVAGKRVASLIEARLPAGEHSALYRAPAAPAGRYFARLRAGGLEQQKSFVLVK